MQCCARPKLRRKIRARGDRWDERSKPVMEGWARAVRQAEGRLGQGAKEERDVGGKGHGGGGGRNERGWEDGG